MARPIDAYTLNNDLVSWYNDTEDETEKSVLRRVMQRVVQAPTLTPPNEWVNRVRELDELYTKLQIVTGFTAEQLLEIFAAGYTLEKPDYSKKFAEMENLAEAAQPNEPLTMGDAKKERYIWFTPLNDWAKVTPFGVLFFGSEELMTWETLCEEWGYRFKAYRRPPEGEEEKT